METAMQSQSQSQSTPVIGRVTFAALRAQHPRLTGETRAVYNERITGILHGHAERSRAAGAAVLSALGGEGFYPVRVDKRDKSATLRFAREVAPSVPAPRKATPDTLARAAGKLSVEERSRLFDMLSKL